MRCPKCETEIQGLDTLLAHRVHQLSNDRLTVYDCVGQRIFPVYGASGGVAAEYVFYVVDDSAAPVFKLLCVRMRKSLNAPTIDTASLTAAAALAVEKFDALSRVVKEGGDLGLEGLDLRTGELL